MSDQPPPSAPVTPPPPPAPYAGPPPPEAPGVGSQGPSGPRAGFWVRFGAALIDVILLGIVQSIINALLGRPAFGVMYGFGATPGVESNPGADLLNTLIGLAYFSYFHGAAAGQTVGNKLLGIRVIDYRTGGPIGMPRAALRWLCSILSAIPCGLGYFWMLWDKEKQTWHDKLSNTVVVPASSYPVAEWPGAANSK